MYSVSNDYKAKMLDQVQTHKLRGVLNGSISFTEADVIGVSYRNQCSGKNVSVGSVNIGTLKLTFLRDLLDRGDYAGKTITISDGLLVDNEDPENPVFEYVPVGTFYIAEAVWKAEDMIDITAYDCLSKMDKALNIDQSSGTLYSFCSYIALQTGTTFGMTEEECEALPNGTEVIAPYEENNMETWRDLLSALASFIGGFAYADRSGTWKLKTFEITSILTIPKDRRIKGSKFSDFESAFDTMTYVDIQSGLLKVYGDNLKLTMSLGMNPFLQYGTITAINRRAENILAAVKKIAYTPFDVSGLPAFIALDLADVVSFTDDYSEDTSYGAVMSLTWTYNKNVKLQCFGENPNLRNAQTKTDKDVSGLINNASRNELKYYNFANVESLTFGPEEETSIAKIRFTSSQETTVKIFHEFIFDMESDLSQSGSYELRYYLDGELLPYKPYERINGLQDTSTGATELSICRDFFYVLKNVDPSSSHLWEVRVITHGIDTTTIDVDHAHITLEGQRLYGEDYFDGYIEVFDTITLIPLGYLSLVSITESALVTLTNAALINGSDSIPLYDLAGMPLVSVTENIQIFMEGGFYIATEDGKYLTTESDERLITEE